MQNSQPPLLVIGAGVIGLACAAELARRGSPPLVIERHRGPGQEATSRNSEVIHAGLYYEPGSHKAELCVEGRERLYHYCQSRQLGHKKLGKLVVATAPHEIATLEKIRARGLSNRAGALEILDAHEVRVREPRIRAAAALWSPESGIVDALGLCNALLAELEQSGGAVAWRAEVLRLEHRSGAWSVTYRNGGASEEQIEVGCLINAAGVQADRIAQAAGIEIDASGLRQHPCKGDYFSISPQLGVLTQRLVYPVPVAGGLGIHLTPDLAGRFRAGPDVEWRAEPDLVIDAAKAESFSRAVARYLPELRAADLAPDYAGIRAKLQAPGEPARDFHIAEASALGAPGLINLLGIESPGLTASLAIGNRVADLVAELSA